MEAPSTPSGRRTLTPAVLLAVIFTTACALASVAFVAARGGLDLPLAMPVGSLVARASAAPTPATTGAPSGPATAAPPSILPLTTPAPTTGPPTPPGPTPVATPGSTADPLASLPGCPGRPGCYEYTIRRGDTFSAIAARWRIPLATLKALNPEVVNPSTIVVGQLLYLARSPFARLEPCGDAPGCYLYVVRPGDRLSTIADHFGTSLTAILAVNPRIADPSAIYSGQTIRLPGPSAP